MKDWGDWFLGLHAWLGLLSMRRRVACTNRQRDAFVLKLPSLVESTSSEMGERKKSWAQQVGTVDIGIYGSSGKRIKSIGKCGEDDDGGRKKRREMVSLWVP